MIFIGTFYEGQGLHDLTAYLYFQNKTGFNLPNLLRSIRYYITALSTSICKIGYIVLITFLGCTVTAWSQWSPCSETCDRGTRTRLRMYENPSDANNCDNILQETESCLEHDCDSK